MTDIYGTKLHIAANSGFRNYLHNVRDSSRERASTMCIVELVGELVHS
jgi:hypothetical protein